MPNLLIDTNLLLLLVVGSTDRSYVSRHKRLQAYSLEDYDKVMSIVSGYSGLVTCPNVWTETSNLVRYAPEPIRSRSSETLKTLIGRSTETYVESRRAATRREYSQLGLTDAVLLVLAESGSTLLTDDLDVYLAAGKAGHTAINYNHLRD